MNFFNLTNCSPRSAAPHLCTVCEPRVPVQQSTKFEFVINQQTARLFDIEVPNSVRLLADEVIE